MSEPKELIIPEALSAFAAGLETIINSVTRKTPKTARKTAFEQAEFLIAKEKARLKKIVDDRLAAALEADYLTEEEAAVWSSFQLLKSQLRTYRQQPQFQSKTGYNNFTLDDGVCSIGLANILSGARYYNSNYDSELWTKALQRVPQYKEWMKELKQQHVSLDIQLKAIQKALFHNDNAGTLEEKTKELVGLVTEIVTNANPALLAEAA